MNKKVAFYTLGCRVNQYETAAMESLFIQNGYTVIPFHAVADIYVINTCAVTAESERKCRQILRRAKHKNPASIVVAAGCMAQASKEVLQGMPEVDIVLGVTQKNNIIKALEDATLRPCYVEDVSRYATYQEMKVDGFEERDRAFVKIQDGCDNFCSYCIIPYVRGRVRSRELRDVLEEIQRLSDAGFREVVLTGIHVASYGRGTKDTLCDLIRRVAEIDAIRRIRLSSIDPIAFDDAFFDTYRDVEKLCPHFHISLQSGSNSVLERMHRRYTAEAYASVVKKLRAIRPDTAITTDIITGFPGETESEFQETLDFTEQVALSGIHVFPYSERKGTLAEKMKDPVPKPTREARAKVLIEKAAQLRNAYAKQFVGTIQPVLFEHTENCLSGFTPHFLRVEIPGAAPDCRGKIQSVAITDCKGEILYGKYMP